MNKKVKELELKNTHFVTPHGLDNENHYSTAYELAIIANYALKNEVFAKIVNTKMATIHINGYSRNIYNTNELLGYSGVDGIKTGFTNGAGRCLVTSCTRDNDQIITVVLGCDTKKKRTADSIKLIEYAFKNYTRIDLEKLIKEEFDQWKQINLNRIYVNKAKEGQIEVELEEIKQKQIPIKIGKEKDIKIEINSTYNYDGPLNKGTKIGNIVVKNKDEIIETIDIACKKTVERKNIFDYMKEILLTFSYNNKN